MSTATVLQSGLASGELEASSTEHRSLVPVKTYRCCNRYASKTLKRRGFLIVVVPKYRFLTTNTLMSKTVQNGSKSIENTKMSMEHGKSVLRCSLEAREPVDNSMPRWLTGRLIADGVMTSERVTMKAKRFRCKDCGVFVLRAMDDDSCARVVSVDYCPTTAVGELWVMLYRPTALRYAIDVSDRLIGPRDAACVKAASADETFVHVQHDCTATRLPINPVWLERKRRTALGVDDAHIPF